MTFFLQLPFTESFKIMLILYVRSCYLFVVVKLRFFCVTGFVVVVKLRFICVCYAVLAFYKFL